MNTITSKRQHINILMEAIAVSITAFTILYFLDIAQFDTYSFILYFLLPITLTLVYKYKNELKPIYIIGFVLLFISFLLLFRFYTGGL